MIGVSPFGGTVIGASLLQTANTNVGPSGNLSIDTGTLDIEGGGVIATSMFFSGDPISSLDLVGERFGLQLTRSR